MPKAARCARCWTIGGYGVGLRRRKWLRILKRAGPLCLVGIGFRSNNRRVVRLNSWASANVAIRICDVCSFTVPAPFSCTVVEIAGSANGLPNSNFEPSAMWLRSHSPTNWLGSLGRFWRVAMNTAVARMRQAAKVPVESRLPSRPGKRFAFHFPTARRRLPSPFSLHAADD